MSIDWRRGYARQAISDFRVFEKVCELGVPVCHQLHYLQMASEKMAKAMNTPPGTSAPLKTTHKALVMFVRNARSDQRIFNYISPYYRKMQRAQFNACVASFESLAQQIEDLSPKGGSVQAPNPEYPWIAHVPDSINPSRTIQVLKVPCEEPFNNLRPESAKVHKFREFLASCIRYLEKNT